MSHWAFIPLVHIADQVSNACLEILRASVIPIASINTRTNGVAARICALLFIFSARDIDGLLAKRIVEQFHEDIARDYTVRNPMSVSSRFLFRKVSLLRNVCLSEIGDGLLRARWKIMSIAKKFGKIRSS